ncbi:MAG: deoxyribodipyrimidine photo-lyase [Flavobacteriales bacterium]|nr:deoxyribodipyrimidine photo-lyase [Flavobacteriales bacterium]
MKISDKPFNICWFRRDLRIEDNHALFESLNDGPTLPLFIFDQKILFALEDKSDARVQLIHDCISSIKAELEKNGGSILVVYGNPLDVIGKLISDNKVEAIYTNRDYEPYARARDTEVYNLLESKNIPFRTFKDHVIFEKKEVVKDDSKPYSVFTPYSRKWKSRLTDADLEHFPSEKKLKSLLSVNSLPFPRLDEIGFSRSRFEIPTSKPNLQIISGYSATRDFPALHGTSRLGVHLRFGTISIRSLVKKAHTISPKFLDELIWREFYQMIIFFFPQTVNKSFHEKYDRIAWENDPKKFEKWCSGKTGYPIVDAGMRELNETGYMHNRVRMVVASFLTKHLLIDWRWGEKYFASKLLDFELASNVGGWQWAAGCGCDAAPYFRVFNPTLQQEKFDPKMIYIKRWVPEISTNNYPKPIVEHTFARNRAIATYKSALQGAT